MEIITDGKQKMYINKVVLTILLLLSLMDREVNKNGGCGCGSSNFCCCHHLHESSVVRDGNHVGVAANNFAAAILCVVDNQCVTTNSDGKQQNCKMKYMYARVVLFSCPRTWL